MKYYERNHSLHPQSQTMSVFFVVAYFVYTQMINSQSEYLSCSVFILLLLLIVSSFVFILCIVCFSRLYSITTDSVVEHDKHQILA